MKTNLVSYKKKQQARESALMTIAAQIQPLPENVVPSERFLEQMRNRLLSLSSHYDADYRAA